jgi:hypothetical protein
MTARGRAEKPAGSWTPDQVIDMLLERMAAGDFYIMPGQRCHARCR